MTTKKKSEYFKRYYQHNKGRYKTKQKKKEFKKKMAELYPNKVKQHWYRYGDKNYKPTVAFTIVHATVDKPLICSFD